MGGYVRLINTASNPWRLELLHFARCFLFCFVCTLFLNVKIKEDVSDYILQVLLCNNTNYYQYIQCKLGKIITIFSLSDIYSKSTRGSLLCYVRILRKWMQPKNVMNIFKKIRRIINMHALLITCVLLLSLFGDPLWVETKWYKLRRANMRIKVYNGQKLPWEVTKLET